MNSLKKSENTLADLFNGLTPEDCMHIVVHLDKTIAMAGSFPNRKALSIFNNIVNHIVPTFNALGIPTYWTMPSGTTNEPYQFPPDERYRLLRTKSVSKGVASILEVEDKKLLLMSGTNIADEISDIAGVVRHTHKIALLSDGIFSPSEKIDWLQAWGIALTNVEVASAIISGARNSRPGQHTVGLNI